MIDVSTLLYKVEVLFVKWELGIPAEDYYISINYEAPLTKYQLIYDMTDWVKNNHK